MTGTLKVLQVLEAVIRKHEGRPMLQCKFKSFNSEKVVKANYQGKGNSDLY